MLISLLTSLLLITSVGDITWEKDYAPARARAQEEGRILFVSVLADDEARAEQFWDDVYSDRRVRALSEETVNLVACLDAQGKKRSSCAQKAGLSRDEARYLEAAIRDELLAKNAEGVVSSPQHMWFSPAGELLQCAAFEMTADEMVWCFVNARRRAGLKHDPGQTIAQVMGQTCRTGTQCEQMFGLMTRPRTSHQRPDPIGQFFPANVLKGTLGAASENQVALRNLPILPHRRLHPPRT